MLNIYETSNSRQKSKAKNSMQNQSTKKENVNTKKTKLHATTIFQTEIIWNWRDYGIGITSLSNKFERDQRLTRIFYEKYIAIEVLQFNAAH